MYRNRILAACLAMACTTLTRQVNAPTDPVNSVTTAVPCLRISPTAPAGGMGGVRIATTPDADSGFWNLEKTPIA